jgi:hypothetical protein
VAHAHDVKAGGALANVGVDALEIVEDMVNGQMANCTSTTTNPTPPSGGWLAGVNKALAANRAKAEANRQPIA